MLKGHYVLWDDLMDGVGLMFCSIKEILVANIAIPPSYKTECKTW